jgi:hypothetical protein
MTRITLKIQQPGEVERHIDRANGAPAAEAAMCCDNGTEEIGHVGYAFFAFLLRLYRIDTIWIGSDVILVSAASCRHPFAGL